MNWCFAVTTVAAAGLHLPAGRVDTPPAYELKVEARTPTKLRLPDGRVALGYLDPAGDFVRDAVHGVGVSGSLQAVAANDPDTGIGGGKTVFEATEAVYEFRSGALTPGTLRYPGKFMPTIGAKVISVNAYTPAADQPRIYNLPGKFVPLPAGVQPKPYAPPSPEPGYRLGGGAADPASAFKFRQNLDRTVGMLRGKRVLFGRLDARGTFNEDRATPAAEYKDQSTAEIRSPSGKPSQVSVINHPRSPRELVYEYRSGYLTAGNLEDGGEFVPVAGAIVISFDHEYRHSESEPRIYNLPGEFIPK
jgi:hypothetical protein